uniref:Leucine-rich repeat-containing protein 7 n=2 Tax=Oncorhynchus mykiss TaxID=8022 RepID=A0A8C7RUT6_ONCMY
SPVNLISSLCCLTYLSLLCLPSPSPTTVQCLEMTTKRKIIGRLVPCRCFRGEEEVISVLDYSHCSLQQVPKEIFSFERTLEELYLDANQIEELPKQLFNCQALRKLSIPDNDLSNLPTTIASLVNLRELDISKNGIQEFPDNIKCCKCLSVVEASVNPIAKLPEVQPMDSLVLVLWGLGPSVAEGEALCVWIGAFIQLPPEVLEQIHNLKELWMDNNSLQTIPGCIGKLRHLRYLDLAKNRIESLDTDISGCESLEDLLLSSNMLQHLPDTIGMLKKLTTLKVDDNQLTSLPNTIGSLSLLEEFDCSCNELESLPPTIGYLHNLRTFSADENFLVELPREIGNCKNVTVMSLRSNKLEFLPDEIGQMTKLHVLNLSDNRLKNLPFTFTKLKDLAALWLSDNQSKALIPLQTEAHPETKQRVLTNYMFPQQPRHDEDYQSDSDSFNPTLWEEQRQQRMTVAFEFEEKKEEEDNSGKVKVEINLKRYPTPYPEDLKNMVKSVQNMVGKNQHPLSTNCSGTNMESRKQEQYEPPWPMPPKEVTGQDSMGGSPNDIRISDMRPTLVEPPMYKPKVVLLGKDKKESIDESDPDKMHCLNNSGSSATYSDYSPSQGSSGSSNPPGNGSTLQAAGKDGGVPQQHWTNRLAQQFPKPIETKPLLSQRDPRETLPSSTLQQRSERRPLSDTFDQWNDSSHYDNTGFVSEEAPMETPSGSSSGNPMLGSKSCSASTSHGGRRPLMRQERIVGIPLELQDAPHQHPSHQFHNVRNTPETEVSQPPPPNPWQNWTRTPSPFEDRTAFPSKLSSPGNSPNPDRNDFEQEMHHGELPGTFPSTGTWGYLDSRNSGQGRSSQQANMYQHVQSKPTRPSSGAMVMSKSSERLSPMMKEVKAKFKKSQSIDEIDMGSYNVYSIPVDTYSSSIENQGSVDRPDMPGPMEQSMSRSQSAPMLDDDDAYGTNSQQQKPSIPKKVYHFDQSFNPQGAMDLRNQQQERRAPPPFPNTPEYVNHPGKTLPKELVSPRGYRGYPPMDQMFSYSQPSVNEENQPPQQQQPFPIPSQRSRPGFLRRADSLVSSTELALFRRVQEAKEMQQKSDHYGRQHFKGMLEHQNSLASMAQQDQQYNKRNGRYEEDYSSYQEPKKPITGYPTKSLTQRRPLSARSYSTETFGASQARPVSARPTMAALLEKISPDYNLSICTENIKSPDEMKMRTMQLQLKPDDMSSKMPVDWRQQLLRHIEAKRLDRSAVLKHNTVNFGMLCSGGYAAPHASRSMTINFYNNMNKHENQTTQWLPLPNTPSQQSNILDNGQEVVSPTTQWAPYSLGRRDVPPENIMKKVGTMIVTSTSATPPHRSVRDQQYEGAINKISIQQYQSPLPMATTTRPQSARCLIQTKGQKSMDDFQEQFCVRIEKNPGLGFSISGGISGQGNPFKPSDMGIFVTRVQPDGPASNLLQPGDKILKANGHSFLHMEHETAVSLLKNFQKTVDLVILRESTI